MKRILFSILVSAILVFSSSQAVTAAEYGSENNTIQRVAISDVITYDKNVAEKVRATSAPTSYAPTSWYNVNHNWSCTKYTYSSYFFDTSAYPNLDVAANSSFTVEFYRTNGTYIGSVTPGYDSSKGKYYGAYYFDSWDPDYYMIIRNNNTTPISSGAWYCVSEAMD